MAPPLAAVLAVLLSLPASAQPVRDAAEAVKAGIARDFAKGTDLQARDYSAVPESLAPLLAQAKYVQAGREPGDEKETYVAFVRSVARRLGARVDSAIALYGDRSRQPRVASAPQEEVTARAAIAEDVKRNPGISQAKKARIAKDMARTSDYLKAGMSGDGNFVGASDARPAALNVTAVPSAYAAVPAGDQRPQQDWTKIPPRVQPIAFVTQPTPSPQTGDASPGYLPSAMKQAMYSLTELGSHIDLSRGMEVAEEAVSNVIDEGKKAVHSCYRFVKQALIDAGVIDAPDPQSTEVIGLRPGMASMFNKDVEKNPKILDELGYRRAMMDGLSDPSQVPPGTILIYGAKCAGMNYENAGHAELTVSRDEYDKVRAEKDAWDKSHRRAAHPYNIRPLDSDDVPACHYTCSGRSMAYLRTYGRGSKACLRMYVPVKRS